MARRMRTLCCIAVLSVAVVTALPVPACNIATQYLDVPNFSCRPCAASVDGVPNNKVPDARTVDASGNALACRCRPGTILQPGACTVTSPEPCLTSVCVACPAAEEVPSRDGSRCMACGNSSVWSAGDPDCTCAGNFVLVEQDATGAYLSSKQCMPCPAGAFVVRTSSAHFRADPYTCQRCPHAGMVLDTGTNMCTCGAGFVGTGVEGVGPRSCVPEPEARAITASYPQDAAATVVFRHVELEPGGPPTSLSARSSVVLRHYFLRSAAQCYQYASEQAQAGCQALANLCVLQHYDPAATACQLFLALRAARTGTVAGQRGWQPTLPWLTYDDPRPTVIGRTDVQLRVAMNAAGVEAGAVDVLSFQLARHGLGGEWRGLEPLRDQFDFCSAGQVAPSAAAAAGTATGAQSGVPRWLRFGVGHTETFTCDLRRLSASARMGDLFDLYLVDASAASDTAGGAETGGAGEMLYPVPVRVVNLRADGGATVNVNARASDERDDRLTRRFFLFDAASGTDEAGQPASVIRYAHAITLTVQVQKDEATRILPPLLSVEYRERLTSALEAPGMAEAAVTLRVEYTMDTSGFWQAVTALFAVTVVGIAFESALRLYNRYRRVSRTPVDQAVTLASALRLCVTLLGVSSNLLFLLLALVSGYVFLVFKMQDSVHMLLPPERGEYGAHNDYYAFYVALVYCGVGQLVRVLDIVYRQTNYDIFFVDWEKSRGVLLDEVEMEQTGDDVEQGRRRRSPPVSVWRMLMVANEWSELETARRTNNVFTILGTVFLLQGLDLQYWAVPRPGLSDLSPQALNPVLRLANAGFWFLLLHFAQRFWRWAILERYIFEPPESQFIDMCTLAKVSAVLLDERYHGYYLHCRSPYPYADASLVEMAEQLRQESEGLTTDRGLPGGPLGTQTFEMFLPPQWRDHYDRVFRNLLTQETAARALRGGQLGAMRTAQNSGVQAASKLPVQRVLQAAKRLSAFLRGFVDQTSSEFPREHRDPTFLNKVLRMPPDLDASPGSAIFLPDVTGRFTSLLFLGVEWQLTLMELLTFCLFDWWTGSAAVAALMAYSISEVITWIRGYFGKVNLANKSLVDSRFFL